MRALRSMGSRFVFLACALLAASVWAQEPTPQESQAPKANPDPPQVAAPGVDTASAPVAQPAPMRVNRGAKLFVEPTEFGMAVSAALLKKKVPVVAVTDKDKADFFIQTVSSATQEKTGERIAKVLMFGAFAGSGRRFEGTVSITNRDGAIVFAHNSKKENFQSAAENVAKNLNKHILGQ